VLRYINMSPDFTLERQLAKKGYGAVFGVDEVGVGPIAGQVTATAVTWPVKFKSQNTKFKNTIKSLKDSKQLTARKREELYNFFREESGLSWATASVYSRAIDKINVFQARQLASIRAVLRLEKTLGRQSDFIILDGKHVLKLARKQEAIIKGDERVGLCAIASIIAKVTRDRAMMRWHNKYPEYRFDLHKGYGTKLHYKMLAKHGPCAIHRRSFRITSK
jgi:ribonuclease HII